MCDHPPLPSIASQIITTAFSRDMSSQAQAPAPSPPARVSPRRGVEEEFYMTQMNSVVRLICSDLIKGRTVSSFEMRCFLLSGVYTYRAIAECKLRFESRQAWARRREREGVRSSKRTRVEELMREGMVSE